MMKIKEKYLQKINGTTQEIDTDKSYNKKNRNNL